ncbi:hypothetical protein CDL15_Pgr017242 [Punica granatum]|uniref:Uncharacterized protein n=1 Tax=Punica granatum TaxID=22663 RepID=A0A218WR56_PUNGR|nr:hypothetical protein CDL15_Pgr017242 [Punica granatum]
MEEEKKKEIDEVDGDGVWEMERADDEMVKRDGGDRGITMAGDRHGQDKVQSLKKNEGKEEEEEEKEERRSSHDGVGDEMAYDEKRWRRRKRRKREMKLMAMVCRRWNKRMMRW